MRKTLLGIVAAAVLFGAAKAQPVDTVVATNYAPLMVAGDDTAPGFAVEVLQEAASRAGRGIKINFLPFQRALYRLRSDPATLMPALFHGKATDEQYHWLVEIHRAKLRFSTVSGQINDLETARALPMIVLETGTTGDVLLTKLGFDNVVRVTSPEASAQMLAAGRADAWLLTEGLMRQVWTRMEMPKALSVGDVVHEVPICIVASPGLPQDVSAAYRDAVEAMKADGTLDAMLKRYFPGAS